MSKGRVETVVDDDDFVKGTKDLRVSKSMSEAFPAKGHSPIPTPSRIACANIYDGVDTNNEHGRDVIMIQQVINSLKDFTTKRYGQRIPTLDSTPADSPFCLDRSLELPKELLR